MGLPWKDVMKTQSRSMRVLAGILAIAGLSIAAHAQPGVSQARQEATVHARASAALLANPTLVRNPFAVLVKFKPAATNTMRDHARAMSGTSTLRQYSLVPGLELVQVSGPPESAVAALKAMPGVEYAELDVVMRADQSQRFPSETTFHPYSWGMHNEGLPFNGKFPTPGADVNCPEAWFVTVGNPDFVVAVIDTGVQWSHPGIAANIWSNSAEVAGVTGFDDDQNGYVDDYRGWDFSQGDNDPDDLNGHGTHVAGTIGASEGNGGVVGMMWECKIMPLRFLNATGGGWMSDAALAVQYAVNKGVKVSNNSYGYGTNSVNQSLYDAINASKSIGHVFVAAAGNSGTNLNRNNNHYPGTHDLDNIICVAATDMNDQLATFSNYGAAKVDLGAPGVYVLSTYLLGWNGPGSWQAYLDGTSMASPHVAGAVGLVYCQNPTWTYQQVRAQIINTARPVASLAGLTVSGGVLNAAAALGVAYPTPPMAPSSVSAIKLSAGLARINWADNSSNESWFELVRETKVGNSWGSAINLPNVGANTVTTTNSGVSGTNYRYKVRAVNGYGESAWSAWSAQVKL